MRKVLLALLLCGATFSQRWTVYQGNGYRLDLPEEFAQTSPGLWTGPSVEGTPPTIEVRSVAMNGVPARERYLAGLRAHRGTPSYENVRPLRPKKRFYAFTCRESGFRAGTASKKEAGDFERWYLYA